MAKTTGPLMGEQASGTFAHLLTFTKSGQVRAHERPKNQRQPHKGSRQQIFGAIQAAASQLNDDLKDALRAMSPDMQRWNTFLITQTLTGEGQAWTNTAAQWATFDAPTQSAWTAAANAAGIEDARLDYAEGDATPAGLAMLGVARTLYALGTPDHPNTPTEENCDAWADYIAGAPVTIPALALELGSDVLTLAGEYITL